VLIVRADAPYKSFDDLLAAHRRNPGSLNYGSAGVGTPQHIGVEWLQSLSGLKAMHTPYKGSGPCIMGLLSGEIDFVLESGAAASPHVRGGKVRAIGIAGSAKPDDFRDVRQIADSVPGFRMDAWSGLGVSRKVPASTKQYAEQALQACLTDPEFIAKLKAQGGNPGWMGAAQFTQSVLDEAKVTRDIVTQNNIHL
jgi:tripartite-type tricarboxylate transporter receptor subunit TctC